MPKSKTTQMPDEPTIWFHVSKYQDDKSYAEVLVASLRATEDAHPGLEYHLNVVFQETGKMLSIGEKMPLERVIKAIEMVAGACDG